jgi:hypothetical protein
MLADEKAFCWRTFSTPTPGYISYHASAISKEARMGLFRADSVVLSYSNVEAAKQWWMDTFGCKVVRVPQDWDNPLPSDVALTLPGDREPTILLSAQSEVAQARFDRPSPVATPIFCDKLKKAHEHLSSRGVLAGPIQDGGDMQLFEIRDPEGHLIEICKEP